MKKDVFVVGSSGGAALAGSVLDYSDCVKGGMLIGYTWGWWASFLFGWAFSAIETSAKPKIFVSWVANRPFALTFFKII
jgi:hypothetical protein